MLRVYLASGELLEVDTQEVAKTSETWPPSVLSLRLVCASEMRSCRRCWRSARGLSLFEVCTGISETLGFFWLSLYQGIFKKTLEIRINTYKSYCIQNHPSRSLGSENWALAMCFRVLDFRRVHLVFAVEKGSSNLGVYVVAVSYHPFF